MTSIFVTNSLVSELKSEERKKIELWAEATKHLVSMTGEGDYSLAIKVISENNNIPVILVDACDSILENRNFQINALVKILRAAGIHQIYVSDCEADDIICRLVKYNKSGDRSVIVSSDRDLYQLLSKKIIQWSPGQKKYITVKSVLEKYDISAENFCTARAFAGDSSDKIFASLASAIPRAAFIISL